jgi:taurine dioxygenase
MTIEVIPMRNIGVEIRGVNINKLDDPDQQRQLYEAWLEHGVLLFRGIGTSPDIHRALTRCFGPLEEQEEVLTELRVDGEKGVIAVERGGKPGIPSYYVGDEIVGWQQLVTGIVFWHIDTIFTPTICRGGMLRMIEACKTGGNTGWIDTIKIYDALPEEMRRRIDKLEVRHCLRCDLTGIPFGVPEATREASMEVVPYERIPMPVLPEVVHPLVLTHPESGRKALAISPQSIIGIVGMSREESDELLSTLVSFTLRRENMFIHHWEKNDMVLWDNRRMLHCGMGHPPSEKRVAHRTTLAGGMNTGRIYQEKQ